MSYSHPPSIQSYQRISFHCNNNCRNHQMVCRTKRQLNILLACHPKPCQLYKLRNSFYRIQFPCDFHSYGNRFPIWLLELPFCIVQCEALNCNKFRRRKNMLQSIPLERLAVEILYNHFAFLHNLHQLYSILITPHRFLLKEKKHAILKSEHLT